MDQSPLLLAAVTSLVLKDQSVDSVALLDSLRSVHNRIIFLDLLFHHILDRSHDIRYQLQPFLGSDYKIRDKKPLSELRYVSESIIQDIILSEDITSFHFFLRVLGKAAHAIKPLRPIISLDIYLDNVHAWKLLTKYAAFQYVNDIQLLKANIQSFSSCLHMPTKCLPIMAAVISYYRSHSLAFYISQHTDASMSNVISCLQKIYPHCQLLQSLQIPHNFALFLLIELIKLTHNQPESLTFCRDFILGHYYIDNKSLRYSQQFGICDVPGVHPLLELMYAVVYCSQAIHSTTRQEDNDDSSDNFCFVCHKSAYANWQISQIHRQVHIDIDICGGPANQQSLTLLLANKVICEYCAR
jgi:hypothetical protein